MVLIAIGALYLLIDPAENSWMPKCVFHAVTGLDCPGCGSQRMLHALLNLDFRSAFEANALLLCSMPYLLLWIVVEFSPQRWPDHPKYSPRLRKLHTALNSRTAVIIIVAALILWFIIRNLHGYTCFY